MYKDNPQVSYTPQGGISTFTKLKISKVLKTRRARLLYSAIQFSRIVPAGNGRAPQRYEKNQRSVKVTPRQAF